MANCYHRSHLFRSARENDECRALTVARQAITLVHQQFFSAADHRFFTDDGREAIGDGLPVDARWVQWRLG